MKSYSSVRVKRTDLLRIKQLVVQLNNANEIGSYDADDVVTLALNSYERKDFKQNEVSLALTNETSNTINA